MVRFRLSALSIPFIAVTGLLAAAGAGAQSASTLITEGNLLYRDGQYEMARTVYSQALETDPGNVRALNNRGLALVRLRDLQGALADLSRALELEKGNGNLWNNRANLNCALGRFEVAFRDRQMAFYKGRFTVEQAQLTLRRLGFFNGFSDAVWDEAEDRALLAWTKAGCPSAPADRLL